MDGEQENRGLTEAAPLNVHYSSRKQAWETPQPFFQRLGDEFRFDIDVCATVNNTKVPKFLLIIDNPLQQTWRGTVWMNPPYGRVIAKWVQKAIEESRHGVTVVCLLPARTDTRWWHDYVMKAAEVRLIKGRLRFGNSLKLGTIPVRTRYLPSYELRATAVYVR